jgi:hypothetical protein
MHRNKGALLSLPSVEVLQQKEIAEAVSRDALSLLEGEEHPVIAVSGGQIAPLCLAHSRQGEPRANNHCCSD